MSLVLDADEVMAFLDDVFPQVRGEFTIDELRPEYLKARLNTSKRHLRPGGTVSGPSMFSLADVATYILVLSHVGPKALAVTTSCSLDFMRKPQAGKDVVAEARLLKLGRVLAVAEILMFSEGSSKPVARASMTYAIPPE